MKHSVGLLALPFLYSSLHRFNQNLPLLNPSLPSPQLSTTPPLFLSSSSLHHALNSTQLSTLSYLLMMTALRILLFVCVREMSPQFVLKV